jgi:hypothetical protein
VNEILVTDGNTVNVLATDNYLTTFGTLMPIMVNRKVDDNRAVRPTTAKVTGKPNFELTRSWILPGTYWFLL